MNRKQALDQHRDLVCALEHDHNRRLMDDPRWTVAEKAGTAILLAGIAVGNASALAAKTDPRLVNAPYEVQIDDLLAMLRDVLITKCAPDLHLVETPKGSN